MDLDINSLNTTPKCKYTVKFYFYTGLFTDS